MSTGSELSRWVDYAVEVSRQPANAFPTLKLLDMLSETFEATIGWNWLQTDGETGWEVYRPRQGGRHRERSRCGCPTSSSTHCSVGTNAPAPQAP
jgi:hypothetical protein